MVARKGRAPILENADKAAVCDGLYHLIFRQIRKANSGERRFQPQPEIAENQLPFHAHVQFTSAFFELPNINSPACRQT